MNNWSHKKSPKLKSAFPVASPNPDMKMMVPPSTFSISKDLSWYFYCPTKVFQTYNAEGLTNPKMAFEYFLKTEFWMDLFGDLRERHLFNESYLHICLVRFCFLDVLQKEFDEYKQFWNTHTIRPVRQSQCPSGKPEAMYHRFDGRNCGFPTSAEPITLFSSQMPPAATLDSDEEDLEAHFSQLQRKSGLPTPLDWEAATEKA
ncbi:uncharacterized protein LOC118598745 [Oryzias melastigma]|uniref:uncharacterized protein LOC118598745 n=1 Tax=Oryzias melastigma TaxID=30732 RepID=UPI00168D42E5|nr:uncharacterized protein LOC118598745 [Oryzias melastigma]